MEQCQGRANWRHVAGAGGRVVHELFWGLQGGQGLQAVAGLVKRPHCVWLPGMLRFVSVVWFAVLVCVPGNVALLSRVCGVLLGRGKVQCVMRACCLVGCLSVACGDERG